MLLYVYMHYTYYALHNSAFNSCVGGYDALDYGGYNALEHGGYNALDYRRIQHGDAGKLGNYPILSYLPDKFERFLYEFHAFRFESLDLPPLTADRSDFDVHGALTVEQVCVQKLLQYLSAILVSYRGV